MTDKEFKELMANEVTVEAILTGIERYRQIKDFMDQGVKELARALHEKVRRQPGQEWYMVHDARWYYKYGDNVVVLVKDNLLPVDRQSRAIITPIQVFVDRKYDSFLEGYIPKYMTNIGLR